MRDAPRQPSAVRRVPARRRPIQGNVVRGQCRPDLLDALDPGGRLGRSTVLAEQHGVHISTIHRVMSLLKDRELVEGHPGKGVCVAEPERESE
ncbi:hypothetical protein [Micromonospora palythoicola]|uniref:hypothetical protein n=1 Tax=Micromonospora palythoicola TaxID=3120507 RepID=UPI002FCE53F2